MSWQDFNRSRLHSEDWCLGRRLGVPGGRCDARLRAGSLWQETGLVFRTRWGTPIEPRNATRSFQRLLARAGLRPMRFHDLRHSCATLLLVQGVSPRVVMEILGHSQINVRMNTYSHVIPALQRDAAARLDELLMGEANE